MSSHENPDIGIYLKLYLEYPAYAKFGDKGYCGFLVIANKSSGVWISLENKTGNEERGFIVNVEDKNGNGVIDSGDIFHIYGRPLNGYNIMFGIVEIGGNIHNYIP